MGLRGASYWRDHFFSSHENIGFFLTLRPGMVVAKRLATSYRRDQQAPVTPKGRNCLFPAYFFLLWKR
jgi:hypothetical protein